MTDFVQNSKAISASTAVRQHSVRVYSLTGVNVLCDTPATRILFGDSRRATSVLLVSGKVIHLSKEIIVSCGTQRTPQLLMLSGIGPASELSKQNIPLLLDTPAISQKPLRSQCHDHIAQAQRPDQKLRAFLDRYKQARMSQNTAKA
ncbi:hypothetical protein HBI56_159190 [Parastagonospora nodorum]|uniref:Glucose-methanol-choline oxidoreductase N-terminal domain-containing protein n=2 Tax=Phaeosphaeria nodorum (strain SN15 / ATCC MYA-4574 / FGSC 10173) TaxID=321614 RepID=A0A7U2ESR9_PHANO|nr:hypothetical protein SNOG_02483 [Parastagonospora nodorum SN15]KAH3907504.1 hypothetical protein HBH56_189900 [Parastagonospora nodorum]EAT90695.2 hypothetical protein SNOG_02483 [Parastagonospora nodorum SN15]KAH3925116.1 hypothetical protein HBH54_185710 [Parastagonospora nodorum]KAH3954250.1 hypothetical protein HBH53_025060 [Parastagonospora nodorum]KAH3963881.1 hypothetical protein HBH51_164900 [Parastagonospora nodorum]